MPSSDKRSVCFCCSSEENLTKFKRGKNHVGNKINERCTHSHSHSRINRMVLVTEVVGEKKEGKYSKMTAKEMKNVNGNIRIFLRYLSHNKLLCRCKRESSTRTHHIHNKRVPCYIQSLRM